MSHISSFTLVFIPLLLLPLSSFADGYSWKDQKCHFSRDNENESVEVSKDICTLKFDPTHQNSPYKFTFTQEKNSQSVKCKMQANNRLMEGSPEFPLAFCSNSQQATSYEKRNGKCYEVALPYHLPIAEHDSGFCTPIDKNNFLIVSKSGSCFEYKRDGKIKALFSKHGKTKISDLFRDGKFIAKDYRNLGVRPIQKCLEGIANQKIKFEYNWNSSGTCEKVIQNGVTTDLVLIEAGAPVSKVVPDPYCLAKNGTRKTIERERNGSCVAKFQSDLAIKTYSVDSEECDAIDAEYRWVVHNHQASCIKSIRGRPDLHSSTSHESLCMPPPEKGYLRNQGDPGCYKYVKVAPEKGAFFDNIGIVSKLDSAECGSHEGLPEYEPVLACTQLNSLQDTVRSSQLPTLFDTISEVHELKPETIRSAKRHFEALMRVMTDPSKQVALTRFAQIANSGGSTMDQSETEALELFASGTRSQIGEVAEGLSRGPEKHHDALSKKIDEFSQKMEEILAPVELSTQIVGGQSSQQEKQTAMKEFALLLTVNSSDSVKLELAHFILTRYLEHRERASNEDERDQAMHNALADIVALNRSRFSKVSTLFNDDRSIKNAIKSFIELTRHYEQFDPSDLQNSANRNTSQAVIAREIQQFDKSLRASYSKKVETLFDWYRSRRKSRELEKIHQQFLSAIKIDLSEKGDSRADISEKGSILVTELFKAYYLKNEEMQRNHTAPAELESELQTYTYNLIKEKMIILGPEKSPGLLNQGLWDRKYKMQFESALTAFNKGLRYFNTSPSALENLIRTPADPDGVASLQKIEIERLQEVFYQRCLFKKIELLKAFGFSRREKITESLDHIDTLVQNVRTGYTQLLSKKRNPHYTEGEFQRDIFDLVTHQVGLITSKNKPFKVSSSQFQKGISQLISYAQYSEHLETQPFTMKQWASVMGPLVPAYLLQGVGTLGKNANIFPGAGTVAKLMEKAGKALRKQLNDPQSALNKYLSSAEEQELGI